MTRASELRDLNDDELADHLAESREELFHLRFQLAMGKQDNSSRLGHVRREVARVLTLQKERERAGTKTQAVRRESGHELTMSPQGGARRSRTASPVQRDETVSSVAARPVRQWPRPRTSPPRPGGAAGSAESAAAAARQSQPGGHRRWPRGRHERGRAAARQVPPVPPAPVVARPARE